MQNLDRLCPDPADPYVEGVGYATVQDLLLGGLRTAPLLMLFFACKLAATCLSLGSGSSGGIFSPSLFMGATLGGALGTFCANTISLAEAERSGLRNRWHGGNGWWRP